MLVKQLNTGKYWTLKNGIADSNWAEEVMGGIDSELYSGVSDAVLTGHTALALNQQGKLIYYDKDNPSLHFFGIATNSGIDIIVRRKGLITELSWNWIVQKNIFAGSNGTLTQTKPITGSLLVIGYAINNKTMLIEPKNKIIIGG